MSDIEAKEISEKILAARKLLEEIRESLDFIPNREKGMGDYWHHAASMANDSLDKIEELDEFLFSGGDFTL